MSNYKIGYKKGIIDILKKRTAKTNAAFLLPHLKPEMKLLDCGCGPGFISADFAKILTKGAVVGIDIEQSQIDLAIKLSKKEHLHNVSFQRVDLLEELPFENNFFDVVFIHAVLSYFKNNVEIIQKLFRIIKPNGIIAVRDIGGIVVYSDNSLINEHIKKRIELLGRASDLTFSGKLRKIFLEAGCNKIISSASAETPDIKVAANHYIEDLDNSMWQQAVRDGLTNKLKIKQYKQAWDSFAKSPESFIAWTWCEAIGFKP